MIAVIQCAKKKRRDAGHLVTSEGKPVLFVAHPDTAPRNGKRVFAHPDDRLETGKTWREALVDYNRSPANNPLGLLPAYQLYENVAYRRLVEKLGANRVYILSAGWGLITAGFLTPCYDITLSPSASGPNAYKRRRNGDAYNDLCMLPTGTDEEVVFFGGKEYVRLFCALTSRIKAQRTIFHSCAVPPSAAGCNLMRFETTTRTNWHYECVKRILYVPA